MNIFEVYFRVESINLKSVGLACMLETIGSSKHSIRAHGDFGFLAANSILLEKKLSKRDVAGSCSSGERLHLLSLDGMEEVACVASLAYDDMFASIAAGSVCKHNW